MSDIAHAQLNHLYRWHHVREVAYQALLPLTLHDKLGEEAWVLGHAPPSIFLQPLRLLMVASETIIALMATFTVIFIQEKLQFYTILIEDQKSNFLEGGAKAPLPPPPQNKPSVWHT